MRPVFVALAVAMTVSGTAYARPEWTDPVKGMKLLCGFMDANYIRVGCKPAGAKDPRDTWRQHLGSDFSASVGATVVAPVKGTVVIVDAAASKDPAEAFLVIRDAATNEEHVIGHISSNLRVGARVEKGATIGWVRNQGNATHVHWGFNVKGVAKAIQHATKCYRAGKTQNCKWGWGKAPFEATASEVRDQGWRNVL